MQIAIFERKQPFPSISIKNLEPVFNFFLVKVENFF